MVCRPNVVRRLTTAFPAAAWAETPPRLPGWYWHRTYRQAPRFCRVESHGGRLMARFLECEGWVDQMSGEWAAA